MTVMGRFKIKSRNWVILILGLSAVIYSDFRAFTKKKDLYNESLGIEELISKYDSILNEANGIRAKVEFLKRKEIDDNELRAFLKKSESFLTMAENIKAKHSELIDAYNHISKQYNSLPHQKLFFSGDLPNTIKGWVGRTVVAPEKIKK